MFCNTTENISKEENKQMDKAIENKFIEWVKLIKTFIFNYNFLYGCYRGQCT